jgi:hypothetical protein
MSKFIKYDSTLTDVTAFSGNFDHRELSGRPEFTSGNTYTTIACGFSGARTFEGYNFDSIQGVMLSTVGDIDIFKIGHTIGPLSTVTTLPYLCGGATIDPSIAGYFLTTGTSAGTYTLNTYNSMSVAFPELTATGIIDIVPINAAGFTTLANDINTTITIN